MIVDIHSLMQVAKTTDWFPSELENHIRYSVRYDARWDVRHSIGEMSYVPVLEIFEPVSGEREEHSDDP